MCEEARSCIVTEDSGLSTAFTIAHEIGHKYETEIFIGYIQKQF
jgi:hypothetical protein